MSSTLQASESLASSGLKSRPAWRRRVADLSVAAALWIVILFVTGLALAFSVITAFRRDVFAPGILSGLTTDIVVDAYTDPRVWKMVLDTVWMSLFVAVMSTALGSYFAWVMSRVRMHGARIWEVLIVFPLLMSPFLASLAYVLVFIPQVGLLPQVFTVAGLGQLDVDITSTGGILFVLVTHYAPFSYLFVIGAFRNSNASWEEASRMCGRGGMYTALKIALPPLWGSILSSVVFITILTMGIFTVPGLLGGSSDTIRPLSIAIYQSLTMNPINLQRGVALGSILAILCLTGFYLFRLATRRSEKYVSVTGKSDSTRKLEWKGMRRVFEVVMVIYVLVTTILPYSALFVIAFTPVAGFDLRHMEFSLEGIRVALTDPALNGALVNSLIVTALVPVGAVIIGGFLVFAVERAKIPGTRPLTYIASVPIALPGLVFVSGFLMAFIRTPLYATIFLIGLALLACYLPYAVRIIGNGIAQVSPALEESARLCGSSRGRVARTILLPLVQPSAISAVTLIAVFTIREVDAPLVLAAPTMNLLSTLSWNFSSEGHMQAAAVYGFLQTIIAVLALGVLALVRKVFVKFTSDPEADADTRTVSRITI